MGCGKLLLMNESQAVVFDMDGVIVDSGEVWQRIISELFIDYGFSLSDLSRDAFAGGDNSWQWASYLRQTVGIPLGEQQIIDRVIASLLTTFEKNISLLQGARETIACLADCYPVALASSSPRPVIAFILERTGLLRHFTTWISSDDVSRGKPMPDVYLEACYQLNMRPECCVAVEDSRAGIRAAKAARMKVIAIPQPLLPLDQDTLDLADKTLDSISCLRSDTISDLLAGSC